MDHRAAIMENPELQALSPRVKLRIGIGVAASLQSSTCTFMWTKLAKQDGISHEGFLAAANALQGGLTPTVSEAPAPVSGADPSS